MTPKQYSSFKEIETDLKRIHLEKQILLEEIKGVKYKLLSDLQPYNWIMTGLNAAKKFGVLMLLKKMFISK